MGKNIAKKNQEIAPIDIANQVMTEAFKKTTFKEMLAIQDMVVQNMDHELVSLGEEPVHFFTNGMYMRSLDIPQGQMICGKTHKYSHFTLLTKGSVIILDSEDNAKVYNAPCQWISPEGVKRFIYAYEDSTIVTCHKTDKTTVEEVEEELIIKEYL